MASKFHLASGGIIDFNSSAVTLTHSSDGLELASNSDAASLTITQSGGGSGLEVSGPSTLTGAVIITGGNLNLTGSVNVTGGNLTLTGNSTLSGALTLTGNSSLSGNVNVTGDTTISGALTLTGNSSISGSSTHTGTLSISNTTNSPAISVTNNSGTALSVSGTSALSGVEATSALIYGTSRLSGGVTITGNTSISGGNLTLTGTSTLSGAVTITGNTSISGNTQLTGELTVGIDDSGHDVKFYGNTASAYMLWDTSEDDLKLVGAAGFSIGSNKFTVSSAGLTSIKGTASSVNNDTKVVVIDPESVTTANSTNVALVASLYIDEPNITLGSEASVTKGASLYVNAAPSEAVENYAAYIGGMTAITGTLVLTGQLSGLGNLSYTAGDSGNSPTATFTTASNSSGVPISARNSTGQTKVGLELVNTNTGSSAKSISMEFATANTGDAPTEIKTGRIASKQEQTFSTDGSTHDSSMVFSTTINGSLTERMTLSSAGKLTLNGTLLVTGALAGNVNTDTYVNTISQSGNIVPTGNDRAFSNLKVAGPTLVFSSESGTRADRISSLEITKPTITSSVTVNPVNVVTTLYVEAATAPSNNFTVTNGPYSIYSAGAMYVGGELTVGVNDEGQDVKFFGATSGAYMLWDQSADKLVLRGPTGSGTSTPGILRLETAETSVGDGDLLGKIEFIAPAEADGSDAVALAAAIWAEADATFTTNVNNTDLVFATGKSEAATEKMRLDTDGLLTLSNTGGGLIVAGNTTMSGTLSVSNSSDSSSVTINNNSSGGTALVVSGPSGGTAIQCNNKLNITGNTETTGNISLNGGTSTYILLTGEIRFKESDGGADYVGFKAPSTVNSTSVYTLPPEFPGSNKVLQSTSSGVLSWESNSGGSSNLAGLTDVINKSNDSDFHNSILISTNNTAPTLSNANGANDNIFIGNGSGADSATTFALSTGDKNIVIGNGSFGQATIASRNVVIGDSVSGLLTEANDNVFIGNNTGGITTGSNNVVIGSGALGNSATTVGSSVILGFQAGNSLTTGNKNVLVGYSAGAALTTTGDTVAIGYESAKSTTVGLYNTALGHESLRTNIDGGKNTAIGYHSLYTMEPGSEQTGNNTAVGYNAGKQVTTGTNNTLLGSESGLTSAVVSNGTLDAAGNSATLFTLESSQNTTDDFYNNLTIKFGANTSTVALRSQSYTISDYVGSTQRITTSTSMAGTPASGDTYEIISTNLTTGSNNSFIGYGTGGLGTGSNQTSLGYQAGCSSSNQITLGNPSITALRCADTTIATLSDSRDKENVSDSTYGLSFINSLRPVQYTWNRRNLEAGDENSVLNGKTRLGFLAQELQSAMPNNENEVLDLVYDVNPERLEAKYGNLIPVLVKAIQDLSAANDALVARVTALENA